MAISKITNSMVPFGQIVRLFLIVLLFLPINVYSQKSYADSLAKQLIYLSGEKKVDALNKIAEEYDIYADKSSISYALQAGELAHSLNYQKGIAQNYWVTGFINTNRDNQKALEFIHKSLDLSIKLNDNYIKSNSLNSIGVIYYYTGDYYNAIEFLLNALKIRETLGDKLRIAASLNNIALVHMAIGNYGTALDYLKKAYSVRSDIKDKHGMGILLNNIGEVYSKMGQYSKAIEYFNKALILYSETKNQNLTANVLNGLAVVDEALSDTTSAFKHLNQALEIFKALGRKNGIANVENGLASLNHKFGNSSLAIFHALNALKNAEEIQSLANISIASNILQEEYFRKGDSKKAFFYLAKYANAKDSLISTEKLKKLSKKEYDYRTEQLKKEQESEIEKQKMFIFALTLTIILFLVIFILIYFSYRNKKATNKKLNELNNRLQELNSTKDKFFSIIAHDLKSPFMGLMGYSQILSEEYDELEEDERRTYINSLFDLTRSSYKLLENLLEWSRLQTGKMDFNPVEINLHNELSPTIDLLAKTALNKDIEVLNLIDVNVIIKADKYMLEAAIRNIISNSIKFTQTGGEIKVKGRNTEECVEISIQDNGIGMKDDIIQNLFKIDKNISTNGTANEKGTGLGLLLCKEMVERHNGKIWATSNVGIGSTFFITLPND